MNRKHKHIRNSTVDVLKGVCIVFVLITHYRWSNVMRTRLLFPYWIDMSVPIFMFISGYVGSLSNIRHKIDGLTDSYTLNNIMRKGIRYTIPFLITFLVEETLFWLDPQTKYSLFEIVMHFLSGGGRTGELLLSSNDAIYFYFSSYRYCSQKI